MSLTWLNKGEEVIDIADRIWVSKKGRLVEQVQMTLDDYMKQ